MKKVKLLFVALLTVALSLLCLASCGTAGTYKFKSMDTLLGTVEVGEKYLGQEVTEDFIVIILNDDNTVSFTKEGETSQGTWKDGEEDNTVVITVAHVINITATLDGGTMVFDWDLLGRVTLEK